MDQSPQPSILDAIEQGRGQRGGKHPQDWSRRRAQVLTLAHQGRIRAIPRRAVDGPCATMDDPIPIAVLDAHERDALMCRIKVIASGARFLIMPHHGLEAWLAEPSWQSPRARLRQSAAPAHLPSSADGLVPKPGH